MSNEDNSTVDQPATITSDELLDFALSLRGAGFRFTKIEQTTEISGVKITYRAAVEYIGNANA